MWSTMQHTDTHNHKPTPLSWLSIEITVQHHSLVITSTSMGKGLWDSLTQLLYTELCLKVQHIFFGHFKYYVLLFLSQHHALVTYMTHCTKHTHTHTSSHTSHTLTQKTLCTMHNDTSHWKHKEITTNIMQRSLAPGTDVTCYTTQSLLYDQQTSQTKH